MATTPSVTKGRLIRCTVPGLTPNPAAILRIPGLPEVARASRIRFSKTGAIGGYPRRFPSSLTPRKGGTRHRQKSLNRSGASSVYLTVCWMFSDRVSWPAFAKA
jgi:hypothetical protein